MAGFDLKTLTRLFPWHLEPRSIDLARLINQ